MDVIGYVFLLLNIAIVPLFLDKNLINFYIIPKQYVFGGLILLNVLFWITKFVLTKKISFTKSMLDIPILSILIIALLSSIFSVNVYDSFFGRAEYFVFSFVLLVLFVVFYYLVINFVNNENRWRGLVNTLLTVGFLTFVIFIVKITLKPAFLNNSFIDVTNTVGGANSIFGLWTIVLLILSLGLLIKKGINIIHIIGYSIVALTAFAVLIMLSFKVLWVILLIGLVLLLLLGISFLREARLVSLSVTFFILILTIIAIIFNTPKFLQAAVPTEVTLGLSPSWSITTQTLFDGVKNFFLGSGLGSFGVDFSKFRTPEFNMDSVAWSMRFNQPYNSILALLSEAGILLSLAIVFLVLLLFGHVFHAWNKYRPATYSPVGVSFGPNSILFEAFLMAVVFFVLTIGLGFIYYSQLLWWLWWLVMGLMVIGFSSYNRNFTKDWEWTLEDSPQYSLAFSFGLIVFMTALIMVSMFGVRLYLAEISYANAVRSVDLSQAEKYINSAIEKRPNSDVYHTALAQVYLSQAVEESKTAKPDMQNISAIMAKAVNEAKYAADLFPKSVALWENLATMYENAAALVPEARDWAIKSLEQARDLEPTNPTHWWRLGNSYTGAAKWEDAIKNYEKAIELKPDYFGAYIGLSNAYEQTQKMDKAIEVYEKLMKQSEVNPETLYNYGRLIYNRNTKGDRGLAEKIWLQVVEQQPNYSNALYSLGLLYEMRGDKNTALQYYYRVRDLNPDNKEIFTKIKNLVGIK